MEHYQEPCQGTRARHSKLPGAPANPGTPERAHYYRLQASKYEIEHLGPSSVAPGQPPSKSAPPEGTRSARHVLPEQPRRGAENRGGGCQSYQDQPGGDSLIAGARKLPSGAFALTFRSAEAKRA